MSSTTKIGSVEAIFLILIITVNHIILNLPKNILSVTESSSLISVFFLFVIALCIVALICKLFKNFPSSDILDISEFLGGKVLKSIIGVLFIIFFLITAATFLRSFCESLKLIYFPRTPIAFLILLFIIMIVITNKLGGNAVIRANVLILPIVLFSIAFIFIANAGDFVFERIFPIFGNGLSTTLFSSFSNLFAFGGISLLYFIPPSLNQPNQFKKIAFTSIILSAIWLFLSVSTLLFIFPSVVTTDEILPLYYASRFIEFGRFFQRLDAIFLLVWIVSMASYLSIVMSFSVNAFKKTTNFKYVYLIIYGFAIILFILSLIPRNSAQLAFLEYKVYQYNALILVYFISISILVLANLKHKNLSKQKGEILLE